LERCGGEWGLGELYWKRRKQSPGRKGDGNLEVSPFLRRGRKGRGRLELRTEFEVEANGTFVKGTWGGGGKGFGTQEGEKRKKTGRARDTSGVDGKREVRGATGGPGVEAGQTRGVWFAAGKGGKV